MRLLAADDAVRQSGSKVNTEQFRTCAIAMPKLNSKLSRELANVKEQLKKGTTRGRCPRPLTPQEIQNLEARRKELQEAMVKARLKDREDPVIAAPASPLPESEKDGGSNPEGADEEEDIPAAPPLASVKKKQKRRRRKSRAQRRPSWLHGHRPSPSRRTWQRGPRRRSPSRGESRRLLCRRPGSKTM